MAACVAPGAFKHLWQHEHRHVTTDAVTLTGDLLQSGEHRSLRRRIAVVELQRVRPARKKRVAPVRQNDVTTGTRHPGVVVGLALEVGLGS
jgi:hypothetical protein